MFVSPGSNFSWRIVRVLHPFRREEGICICSARKKRNKFIQNFHPTHPSCAFLNCELKKISLYILASSVMPRSKRRIVEVKTEPIEENPGPDLKTKRTRKSKAKVKVEPVTEIGEIGLDVEIGKSEVEVKVKLETEEPEFDLDPDVMTWNLIPCLRRELRLDFVLKCGQSFRWKSFRGRPDQWVGVLGRRVFILTQDDLMLKYKTVPALRTDEKEAANAELFDYFQLGVRKPTVVLEFFAYIINCVHTGKIDPALQKMGQAGSSV